MLLMLILPAVAVVLFISYYLLYPWIHRLGYLELTAIRTQRLISRYIEENDGNFPASEDDLISKKYIKKDRVRNGYEYYLKLNPNDPYYKYANFKYLKIAYGTRLEDIALVNDKLYDKSTNKQLLLIDGPYRKFLKGKCYEPMSVKLYGQMVKEKSE